MANRFVEGFATYGIGSFNATQPQALAMLAGRWASLNGISTYTIGNLPWAVGDTDLYLSSGPTNPGQQGARTVLPTSATTCIMSAYVAVNQLPIRAPCNIVQFCDNTNTILAGLFILTTGALALIDGSGNVLASTSGPAMTAESAAHVECSMIYGPTSNGQFTCQVNGQTVITATGLTFTSTQQIAQLRFIDADPLLSADFITEYIGNLILRDSTGSVNNGIVGDRRVATLFVDADDPAHQGWAGRPLHCFGNGILDLTNGANTTERTMVIANGAPALNLSNGQYTIEGQFRFQALPTGANKSVLFGCWDEGGNKRSYQLYVGGPSLESGNTVFRISTDGTAGTVNELISWAYQWLVGEYYHVALARDGSANLRLFINGIQQDITITDANAYYSPATSGPLAVLGGQYDTSLGAVSGSSFQGWMDEFRLTVGACRYTANFTPPVAAFPRGGSDPDWAEVSWLSGWDLATLADESSYARALTSVNGAAAVTPDDGQYNFQVLDKNAPPLDNTFIEAALTSASGVLTYTALPTSGKEVTVATKNGSTPAVYTWVTSLSAAFQVLIGASIAASMSNLAAAINAGAGAGTVYGTGTTANNDVSAVVLTSGQLQVTALIAGSAGNALASTTNDTNAAWTGATLSGGQSIPGYSQFSYARLPSNTTTVDSITILQRTWKTDSGGCAVQASLVGSGGGVENGSANSVTTAPTFYTDTFQTDPDTSGPITPTTVLNAKIRVNRTA